MMKGEFLDISLALLLGTLMRSRHCKLQHTQQIFWHLGSHARKGGVLQCPLGRRNT